MAKDKINDNSWYDRAGNLCSKRPDGSLRVQTINNDPSLTIQSERDSVDIHKILAKYKKSGVLTNIRSGQPLYGDFSSAPDYRDAQNAIVATEASFNALPSALRKHFDNNPSKLLEFLDNPENRSEAIKLGLIDAAPDVAVNSPAPQASEMPLGASPGDTPPE